MAAYEVSIGPASTLSTIMRQVWGPRRLPLRPFSLFLLASFVSATANATDANPKAPDLSGLWGRSSIPYERPSSGPGPLERLRLPSGQRSRNSQAGDYTNPILKPEAAAAVKRFGELAQTTGVSDPETECRPESPPYLFKIQETQIIQQPGRIMIVYSYSNQIRRIRLNQSHPEHVTPSWMGDSVGHFEGDTLVVDTVGIKHGPYSMLDRYGTPYSDALHLVERFTLIDGAKAEAAMRKNEQEYGRIRVGYAVDPNYKGPGLQLQFTVEDPKIFTAPWSGVVTYRRNIGPWPERICAENADNHGIIDDPDLPTAEKPDF
jgi:hypothetical protein